MMNTQNSSEELYVHENKPHGVSSYSDHEIKSMATLLAQSTMNKAQDNNSLIVDQDVRDDMLALETERAEAYLRYSGIQEFPVWLERLFDNASEAYTEVRTHDNEKSAMQKHIADFFDDYYGGERVAFSTPMKD